MKTYTEMMTHPDFLGRFRYLKLNGTVGLDTFGFDRVFNQRFYHSNEWRRVRNDILIRDCGREFGLEDYDISGPIIVHHMNPISLEDISDATEFLMNPEFLVCVSDLTHKAIHYGTEDLLPKPPIERRPGDTCPWKTSARM